MLIFTPVNSDFIPFELRSLSLAGFRNHECRQFEFNSNLIGISGPNGVGKTNLLDAIHYLCSTKSYFQYLDSGNVFQGSEGFRIEGRFLHQGMEKKVVCLFREGLGKQVSCDGKLYERFSEHFVGFPAVIIAPEDSSIISDGSGPRRRWMDTLLCQLDPAYLNQLGSYHRVLMQRNGLLRQTINGKGPDETLLDILDSRLAFFGYPVFLARQALMSQLVPRVREYYRRISQGGEEADILYQSSLLQVDFGELLLSSRSRDLVSQRTSRGLHKDDWAFLLDRRGLRNEGSQGQRKSFLFALKLAQFQILKERKSQAPILLLDDLFDKLDAGRVRRLISIFCEEDYGQIFITDTDEGRLRSEFSSRNNHLQLISLPGYTPSLPN